MFVSLKESTCFTHRQSYLLYCCKSGVACQNGSKVLKAVWAEMVASNTACHKDKFKVWGREWLNVIRYTLSCRQHILTLMRKEHCFSRGYSQDV